MERKNAWKSYNETDLAALEQFSREYRAFLDAGKTERECVQECVRIAEEHGFANMLELAAEGVKPEPGAKLYANWMGKTIMLFVLGDEPLQNGMNILGAHIDSPRIDVKQNPLYEDSDLAYLDTHYYGGIKKYQWWPSP